MLAAAGAFEVSEARHGESLAGAGKKTSVRAVEKVSAENLRNNLEHRAVAMAAAAE
jgi:hypothetical protein